MQRAYAVDDIESLRRTDRVRIALIRACEAGELTHLLETDPPPKERWRYFINAPDFAAWLAAQGETPSTHVAAWFDAVAPVLPSVVPLKKTHDWTVNKPKRFQGYSRPLFNVLKDAHTTGVPVPTVHDVLDQFSSNMPREVSKVHHGEGLDYYTSEGATKHASIRAIRRTIREMTKPRSV